MTQPGSILRYEDRGSFGNNKYHGNCSGKTIQSLYDVYKFDELSDYMCGSNTTGDVAKYLGIKANTYDLNMGFDLVKEEIKERNTFVFNHIPYWDTVLYSGVVFGDKPLENDLSHIHDYSEFVRVTNYCIEKQFGSLKTGGRLAILMADIKKNKKLYSLLLDLAKPGVLENVLIKEQLNCRSDNKQYNGSFFRITHEYILILRKDNPYLYQLKITNNLDLDIRDNPNISWKDLVCSVHEKIGSAELGKVYEQLQDHQKAKINTHWKEKIRQQYYIHPELFESPQKGVWDIKRKPYRKSS